MREMKEIISIKLFRTVRKGKKRLNEESLSRIAGFIESQRLPDGSFVNKSGRSDIYYTLFGWMLSYVLGIKPDTGTTADYLAGQHTASMDLIHYAAYVRCRMIQQLWERGKPGVFLRSLFSSHAVLPEEINGIPHDDPQSPYTQFIRLSLLEDCGQRIKQAAAVTESLKAYHVSGGGYTNIPGGKTASVNATAAALSVMGQLEGYRMHSDVLCLQDMQTGTGGFAATKDSPVPDLLSTATALFVLSCYGRSPKIPPLDFIESHWLDSGGFAATLLDDGSDTEYTFYGLLALGAI
jgi:hypothetical protein